LDHILANLLLLSEGALIGVFLLLVVTGGILGALVLNVNVTFRRVSYLWFLVGANFAITVLQFGWLFVAQVANSGLFSVFIIAMLAAYVLFGMGIFYSSAARSRDVDGTSSNAWMGFIPFANLWLLFKGGSPEAPDVKSPRSKASRYILDPLLICSALLGFVFVQALGQQLENMPLDSSIDNSALNEILTEGKSVEDIFAMEAVLSSSELPLRVDEITVLKSITAEGNTLSLVYEADTEVSSFIPGFKGILAAEQCGQEMFGSEIMRGGKVRMLYQRPNGAAIAEYVIAKSDC